MPDTILTQVLTELKHHPVLVDVGASGATPTIWAPIAKQSVYIGFDPDLREIREINDGDFYRATIVNQAVTADAKDQTHFYLTHSPFCSSTLKPNLEALSNYVFSDLFTVKNEVEVKATTLNVVAQQFNLSTLDWLKVDSQGTDLRLFTMLDAPLRSHVLALDIEPGLIDAYIGEDLFIETHRTLTQSGFWLADLDVQGTVRVKQQTLSKILGLPDIGYGVAGNFLKRSPGWCEARYLRTIESLNATEADESEFALLWVFAMLDNQYGFAVDVSLAAIERFPHSLLAAFLKNQAVERIRLDYRNMLTTPQPAHQPSGLKNRARHLAGRIAKQIGIR